MDKKYLEIAIIFSRMYGVSETLQPIDYLENSEFIPKIREWTGEFLGMGNEDILEFFESKISK